MPYSNRILKEESSKCDAVPQPALQGPYEPEYLYTLFTAILPIIPSRYLTAATYADDTAFLATATNPQRASAIIQRQLDALDPWLKRWNIVVNAENPHIQPSLCAKENAPRSHSTATPSLPPAPPTT
ncbi:GD23920 [Drosophila simulans]|uniref:GD23920 n=1 Tax=Drosophila simulans TaxID=7240 RepID=B4NUX6_DROSI|nr:GD23920 [Drosophila simulans]